jgi:hypothetical protein
VKALPYPDNALNEQRRQHQRNGAVGEQLYSAPEKQNGRAVKALPYPDNALNEKWCEDQRDGGKQLDEHVQ